MTSDSMVHRANQIALYFAAYPHDEAVAGVLNHFKKYWERRMRDQIVTYVQHGGQGLHDLALEAVKRL
ncbi:MAG: formate dehydrogenase subunit delta [Bryobacterales bacterium]|nr:formate dehydrogenase subunit delta [Bryobacterales bacterium]